MTGGNHMTREQVLKLFPDATDEQITNLLNQSNKEVLNEKNKIAQYKEQAEKAAELQEKLDKFESDGLTEVEKANKALETANARIAELEKAQTLATQRNAAVAKFKVTAEQAAQIVKDDGSFDYDVLVSDNPCKQIISDKETAAAKAKEVEIANNSPNPNGSNGGGETQTEAEKIAKDIGSKCSDANKTAESVLKNYM
jgi:hypothetical protein